MSKPGPSPVWTVEEDPLWVSPLTPGVAPGVPVVRVTALQ